MLTSRNPGTCKDRPLMEMDPHQLIEGHDLSRAAPLERTGLHLRVDMFLGFRL